MKALSIPVTLKPYHVRMARSILAAPNAEEHVATMVAHIVRAIDTRNEPEEHQLQLMKLFTLLEASE